MLASMTSAEAWRDNLEVKARCAYNLHMAASNLNLDLEFFIVVSSIASLLGSKGQAAYVAANTYTEDLMAHRRYLGLCGSHLNVGVVSDKGHAHEQGLVDTWRRKGINPITAADACDALGYLISSGCNCAAVSGAVGIREQLKMNPSLLKNMLELNNLSRLRGLATNEELLGIVDSIGDSASLIEKLRQTTSAQERTLMISQELRQFFERRGQLVDEALPLREQGQDSLEMSSLKSELRSIFGVELSSVFLNSESARLGTIAEEIDKLILDAPVPDQFPWQAWYQLQRNSGTVPDHPERVLVVVPPIACGTELVSSWHLQMPNMPIACAKLPGWADRPGEDCVQTWTDLIEKLFQHLEAMLENNGWKTLEFYGHSFGARVAWALAQKIQQTPGLTLHRLSVGAWFGPLHGPCLPLGWHPDSADDARQILQPLKFLDLGFVDKATDSQVLQTAKCVLSSWKMLLVILTCAGTACCLLGSNMFQDMLDISFAALSSPL